MAIKRKDLDTAREYDSYRVDGLESNSQAPERITLAVQPEINNAVVSETNKLPVEVATNTTFVDLFRCLLETNKEILNELKTMNAHFSEWDGDKYDSN